MGFKRKCTLYFPFPQEVSQALEQLKPRLEALCAGMKRLGEGGQLEEEVANLLKEQGEHMEKATEKQATLEKLLALWQRYSKHCNEMLLLFFYLFIKTIGILELGQKRPKRRSRLFLFFFMIFFFYYKFIISTSDANFFHVSQPYL